MAVDNTQRERDAELPDLDSAATHPWPHREFPIRDPGSGRVVQVVLKRSVLNAIHEHGLSQSDVEVCGVMVGQCYQDQRGPFVYIEEIIRGNHSDSQVAQVTFTAETWNHIQHEMDERFEDKRILGWYHTHPGFGIFLSEMDMFIHENFFSGNEQMAFVYDPIGGQAELFLWRNGRAVQDRYLVEEDSTSPPSDAGSPATTAVAAAGPPGIEGFDDRLGRIERRQRWLAVGLLLAVAVALAWPFAAEHVVPPPWSSPPPDDDSDLRSLDIPIAPPTDTIAPQPAVNPPASDEDSREPQRGQDVDVAAPEDPADAIHTETPAEDAPASPQATEAESKPEDPPAPDSEDPPSEDEVPASDTKAVPAEDQLITTDKPTTTAEESSQESRRD